MAPQGDFSALRLQNLTLNDNSRINDVHCRSHGRFERGNAVLASWSQAFPLLLLL